MTKQLDEPFPLRLVSADQARRRYEEARAEAQRLWRESWLAIAQGATEAERLAAAELARDVAFTLWCDLAAAGRSAPGEEQSTP